MKTFWGTDMRLIVQILRVRKPARLIHGGQLPTRKRRFSADYYWLDLAMERVRRKIHLGKRKRGKL